MQTITKTISGDTPASVQLIAVLRNDTGAAPTLSPALPQNFSTADGGAYIYSFTDPAGDCPTGYTCTYEVFWSDGSNTGTIVTALPGAIAATSYLAFPQADLIAATLPTTLVASYTGSGSAQKIAALQAATLDIDAATRWQGRKFDPAQILEFPRVAYESAGRVRPGGIGAFALPPAWGDNVWDWDAVNLVAIVPPKVLTACVHQANYILSGAGSRLDDIHGGLAAQSNMGLSETYDRAAPGVDTNLCLRAWQLLKKYQLSSGRML